MNHQSVQLGVLDFFDDLAQTLALAPAVETLGYQRHWIAEHPPQPGAILVAGLVAGITNHLRVGTAGIGLPFYSPARAAHDFQLLEAAYPGRIDAGFCANGGGPASLLPDLYDGRAEQDTAMSQRRVAALVNYLRATPTAGPAIDPDRVWTGAAYDPPAIWVHGNGPGAMEIAVEHGLALGVSLFHPRGVADPGRVAGYRRRFQARGALRRPHVAVAVAGVCAETEAQAQALRAETLHPPVIPIAIGPPDCWLAALAGVCERFAPDDLIILDLCRHYEDRLRSYRLLAQAFDLKCAPG